VEALSKNERRGQNPDETQFGTKSGAFLSLTLPLKAKVLFLEVFKNLTRFWTKLRVLVPYFPDFTENLTKHPENRSPYVLIP
jgi:hypothetical protein